MLLSEAIRLGAMVKPQGIGCKAAEIDRPTLCALGAAKLASGISDWGTCPLRLREMYPILEQCHTHPEYNVKQDVKTIIYTLNDVYDWTRERIADWVETVEREHAEEECQTELCTSSAA